MTKKQAAEVIEMKLNEIASQIQGAGMLDGDTAEGLRQTITAFNMAHAALSGPVPDPETGLVKCGCGGKPEMRKWKSSEGEDVWYAICPDCHVATAECFWELAAKNDWNGSHGYKEDA